MADRSLITRLREFETNPRAVCDAETVRRALASSTPSVVARAARLISERGLEGFTEELRSAYDRLLETPVSSDPGCEAKTPLCEALRQLEYADADFFLEGIHYRQHEPVWGGAVDAAAEIRAICGFALIQESHPRAMRELVDLLDDPEKAARAGAARAIGHAGGEPSELLLRMKIRAGDPSPEVMGECFAGLLRVNAADNISRVANFLSSRSMDLGMEAALALGECRHEDALAPLCEQADQRQSREYQRVLLTAIGLLGLPGSIDYLLETIAGPDIGAAVEAVEALTHCRDPSQFAERLKEVVAEPCQPPIDRVVAKHFPQL